MSHDLSRVIILFQPDSGTKEASGTESQQQEAAAMDTAG